jgi:hypothetical protein
MAESALRLVKRMAEFRPKDEIKLLPRMLRGVYVLYRERSVRGHKKFDVQYVGMASAGRRGGLRGRLSSHAKSQRKAKLWSHFSVYEVWENIRTDEIVELEGLFRHIYRKDSKASALNIQRGFKQIKRIRQNNLKSWRAAPT